MYLREPFEEKNSHKILSFIDSQKFATFISVDKNSTPIASHLPVDVLGCKKSKFERRLITHLADGNPHLPLITENPEILVIFLSNSNYISPSWFSNKLSAPTQSHIVVHAYGKARVIEDPNELLEVMAYQVKSRESEVNGNWTIENLGDSGIKARLKKISGLEISIDRMEASFRLLQDESKENVRGVLENASLDADTLTKIRKENHIDE